MEGARFDGTYGGDELRRSYSINLLAGVNLIRQKGFAMDVAAVIGVRETSADCPDSYLGYRCYADRDPDVEYEPNLGGLVAFSYRRVMIGVRATDVSIQGMVGTRF